MNAVTRTAQRGVTLIESSIVLGVVALSLGIVAPNFDSARKLRRLEGTAAQLETDLHYARSLAVARNESIRIGFQTGAAAAGGTCYVVHSGSAGDCRCDGDGRAVCQNGAVAYRWVAFGATDGMTVRSNSNSMLFDAAKGTVSPTGTIRVEPRSGSAIHLVVNIMGRVRSCAANGQLLGYRNC